MYMFKRRFRCTVHVYMWYAYMCVIHVHTHVHFFPVSKLDKFCKERNEGSIVEKIEQRRQNTRYVYLSIQIYKICIPKYTHLLYRCLHSKPKCFFQTYPFTVVTPATLLPTGLRLHSYLHV
jgi:hypothetical protein